MRVPLERIVLYSIYSLLLVIWGQLSLSAQTYNNYIEGYVIDDRTGDPVAYANIYNFDNQSGTITNSDGFFSLQLSSFQDSIRISFIGYNSVALQLQSGKDRYIVRMTETSQQIEEVVVTYKEDPFLYELLNECRKEIRSEKSKSVSRGYFEQKSWKDEDQVELVEGFYNVYLNGGHDISEMKLKTGRFALKPKNNRYFITIENSRAISFMKMIEETYKFPTSPLYYGRSRMKRRFFLELEKKYLDDHGDSIYVIKYEPKPAKLRGFSGRFWVDKDNIKVLKAEYVTDSAGRHPFLPLFRSHKIANVSFKITKAFEKNDAFQNLNYIDFSYKVDYRSRFKDLDSLEYSIKSKAILYIYDHYDPFFEPEFYFTSDRIEDYRKINAYPYNQFFWENNDEYKLNDKKKRNEAFFMDSLTYTNLQVFNKIEGIDKKLMQHPFVSWSENRIFLKSVARDTLPEDRDDFYLKFSCNLDVKIFLDINTYGDSTNVLTRTIMDPFNTYYYQDLEPRNNCFVNIYFDLCEIQRRKLQKRIEEVKRDPVKVTEVYSEMSRLFMEEREKYLFEVNRGENFEALDRWNKYIVSILEIDNMDLFKVVKTD